MIKTAIRLQNNMVMVFNKRGKQIPRYQSHYEEVKKSILKNAPSDAVFAHGFTELGELREVSREKW